MRTLIQKKCLHPIYETERKTPNNIVSYKIGGISLM